MNTPHADDRRDATVAAVNCGADGQASRFTATWLELPIVLVAALAAAATSVDGFIARLSKGSIWQEDAVRSADRTIVIQASLAHDGLRAVVQIGKSCWYHHPSDTIHAWGVVLPATTLAIQDVPLTVILRHPLLDLLPIRARALQDLNSARRDLGICVTLDVPRTRYRKPPRAPGLHEAQLLRGLTE